MRYSTLLGSVVFVAALPLLALAQPGPPAAPAMAAPGQPATSRASRLLDALTPVTDDTLLHPSEADWLHWRRTYNAWGFSPLGQINKANVKGLRVAWSWSLTAGASETTPVVHDGVLFVHNNGDKIQALDAATGTLLWEYNRKLPPEIASGNGNYITKRSIAIYGDNLIIATSDVHLLALKLKTGAVAWDVAVEDWTKGWRFSSGPLIADGKIIQGMTGCGDGQEGGCFITAHDPATGKELWRLHTIAQDGKDGRSWNGLPVDQRFGGSAWMPGSYDPDQKTVFWGTGQPYNWAAVLNGLYPASQDKSVTNNALYTDSTLAIDPATGKLKWYFQHLPMDTWDLDYVFERVLVDLPVKGVMRRQVVTAGKLGILESLDRTNGQFLWAKQTVPQNVVLSTDPKTGRKTINQDVIPQIGKTLTNCPADPGGRGWPATAYNPLTHILYMPLNELCSVTVTRALEPGQSRGRPGGITFRRVPVPNSDGNIGRVDAIDLSDQKTIWSVRQHAPVSSAMLPTAGGLVFSGDLDRYFRAYDDATGKVLWQIRTNNIVNSFPISYSSGGKQYVAVAVGNGSSGARSMAGMTREIQNPSAGSTLWVFALPDDAAPN